MRADAGGLPRSRRIRPRDHARVLFPPLDASTAARACASPRRATMEFRAWRAGRAWCAASSFTRPGRAVSAAFLPGSTACSRRNGRRSSNRFARGSRRGPRPAPYRPSCPRSRRSWLRSARDSSRPSRPMPAALRPLSIAGSSGKSIRGTEHDPEPIGRCCSQVLPQIVARRLAADGESELRRASRSGPARPSGPAVSVGGDAGADLLRVRLEELDTAILRSLRRALRQGLARRAEVRCLIESCERGRRAGPGAAGAGAARCAGRSSGRSRRAFRNPPSPSRCSQFRRERHPDQHPPPQRAPSRMPDGFAAAVSHDAHAARGDPPRATPARLCRLRAAPGEGAGLVRDEGLARRWWTRC